MFRLSYGLCYLDRENVRVIGECMVTLLVELRFSGITEFQVSSGIYGIKYVFLGPCEFSSKHFYDVNTYRNKA